MQTISEQLADGTILRVPLLAPGQTINTITHGLHAVTGGYINIGFLGNGTVPRITGIIVNNTPIPFDGVYVPGNQPFNSNFASVLYEMKQAGVNYISKSNLDYASGNRNTYMYNDYVQSYRASIGLGVDKPSYGEVTITPNLINGISR